jgi:hypothetical protein
MDLYILDFFQALDKFFTDFFKFSFRDDWTKVRDEVRTILQQKKGLKKFDKIR